MALPRNGESRALMVSVWANAGMALLGLAFASLTGSEAILLDGAYSLIAMVLAWVTLRTAGLVMMPGSSRFHFGYVLFEPAVNTGRALLILAVMMFAFGSALRAIFAGGHAVEPGLALLYSIVVAAACWAIAARQRRKVRAFNSTLLKLDATNWFIDAAFSAAVGVGFALAWLLEIFAPRYLPYADPLIVILLVLAMLPMVLRILLVNLGQMLLRAPEQSFQQPIHQALDRLLVDAGIADRWVGMVSVGRVRYVMVYLLLDESSHRRSAQAMEQLRQTIEAELREAAPGTPPLEVDVIFTTDARRLAHVQAPFHEFT